MSRNIHEGLRKRGEISRRRILAAGLGGGLVGSGLEAGPTHANAASRSERPPSGVGSKFYPTGQVREWPGDTIICPVEPETALHAALKAIQEAAMAEPMMAHFTLMPVSSLHMTLFAGVDLDHRRAPYWPASLPLDASLAVVDAWIKARLADFHTGGGRFRMAVEASPPAGRVKDFAVRLVAADPGVEAHLRDVRERLAERLEIRAPDHAAYRFHITLGYLIRWLTVEEETGFRELYARWMSQLSAAVPQFEIGPPVFCTFRDMFGFQPVAELRD